MAMSLLMTVRATRVMCRRFLMAVVLLLLMHASDGAAAGEFELPLVQPEAIGFDSRVLEEIEPAIQEGLQAKQLPGCVVAIGRGTCLAYLRAFGHRAIEPEPIPMTTDTVFDLASLTKPIATATSVMRLVDLGYLRITDRVADHLPEFATEGKDVITIEHLLIHQGGLIADNALADYQLGPSVAWERVAGLKLKAPVGTKFIYSDVGFIVLGELVRRVSHESLADFSRRQIFCPLGMCETSYLPNESLRLRAAPTERRNNAWMQGEVHDPRAHLMQGVAGHAGLFSTARDLAKYAAAMANGGELWGGRILCPCTWSDMTTPREVSSGKRALGWDVRTGYSSNRGEGMSDRAFGHGGFTGTAMWIDPETKLFVIFLSNRVHPNGKGAVNPLAGRIGGIAVRSSLRQRPNPQ